MFISDKAYTKLLIFYASYLWLDSFSKSILPTYFFKQNLSFQQIILGTAVLFGGQLLVLLTLKDLSSRIAWRLSLLSTIVYILLITNITAPIQFYLASAIGGFALFFFFVFYNIIHFETGNKQKTGQNSALMFSIAPLVGITAPFYHI